jgi:hypothetical protein
MLTADDIIRIKELADIIRESGAIEMNEDVTGTCVDEDSIANELSMLPDNNCSEQKNDINAKELMILFSLALKRYIIETQSELNESDINTYVSIHGGKRKTLMRSALNSVRFKTIYEACYNKNMQDTGVDSVFEVPIFKEQINLDFIQFLNLLNDNFIKSHNDFKYQMIKISRNYYKNEKVKKVRDELECIEEFLKYYNDNRDIFDDDNLAETLNEAGRKYGPSFMGDIHPILYVYSELLSNGIGGLMFKQLDVVENWLNIRYDDKTDQARISKLFIKMFYSKTPIKKKQVEEMANKYWTELNDLLESEKKNKEDIRKKLLDEGTKIKEARKKDDLKLNLHKKLNIRKL